MSNRKTGRHRLSRTGERYVLPSKRRFKVLISIEGRGQVYVGQFGTVAEAVSCRDKWLTEHGDNPLTRDSKVI